MRRRPKLQVKPNVAPKAASRGPDTSSQDVDKKAADVEPKSEPKDTFTETPAKANAADRAEDIIEKDVKPNEEKVETKPSVAEGKATLTPKPASSAGTSRRSRIRPQVQIRGRGPASTNTPVDAKTEPSETLNSSVDQSFPLCETSDKPEQAKFPDSSDLVPKVLKIAKPACVNKANPVRDQRSKQIVDGGDNLPTNAEIKTETAAPKSPVKDPQQAALRRSRFLRARPNLTEAGRARLRHPSLSQSDVEESPRKPLPAGQRTAALSNLAIASGSGDTRHSAKVTEDEVVSPINKPDVSIDSTDGPYFPKPSTSHPDASVVKEAPVRKRRKIEIVEKPIDRSKVTMKDLIYMNPSGNRMKSTIEEEERQRKQKNVNKNDAEPEIPPVNEEDDIVQVEEDVVDGVGEQAGGAEKGAEKSNEEEDGEDGEALPVPQVSIGADGQIILNEASLVIANKPEKTVDIDSAIIHERDGNFTYPYGRRRKTKLWNLKETKRFYVALSIIGTDFSLMVKFFQNRDRTELKKKFKREEKANRFLVDQALEKRHNFDVSLLDEDSDKEEENKSKKKAGRRRAPKKADDKKKKAPKKTRSRYYSASSSENEDNVATDVRSDLQNAEGHTSKVTGESRSAKGHKKGKLPQRLKLSHTAVTPNGELATQIPGRPIGGMTNANKSPIKSPGQFVSLTNANNPANIKVNQMQPGQFVFVTSTPPANKEGQKPTQLIHVYRVSPSGTLSRELSPAGTPGSIPFTLQGGSVGKPAVVGLSPATSFYGTPRPPFGGAATSPFLEPSPRPATSTPHSMRMSPVSQTPGSVSKIYGQANHNQPASSSKDVIEPLFRMPETPKNWQPTHKTVEDLTTHGLSPVANFTSPSVTSVCSTPLSQTPVHTMSHDSNAFTTQVSTTQGQSLSLGVSTISANICVPVNTGNVDPHSGRIITDITHLVQSGLSSATSSVTDTPHGFQPGSSPQLIQTMDVDIPADIDPAKIISFCPQTTSQSQSPPVEMPIVSFTRGGSHDLMPSKIVGIEPVVDDALYREPPNLRKSSLSPPGDSEILTDRVQEPMMDSGSPGGGCVSEESTNPDSKSLICNVVNKQTLANEETEIKPVSLHQSPVHSQIAADSETNVVTIFKNSPDSKNSPKRDDDNTESLLSSPQSVAVSREAELPGQSMVAMETSPSIEMEQRTIECEIVEDGDDDDGNYIVVEWVPEEEGT